jgi:hypothetical protein
MMIKSQHGPPLPPWSTVATAAKEDDDSEDQKPAGTPSAPWSMVATGKMEASQTNRDYVEDDLKAALAPHVPMAVSEKNTKLNDDDDKKGWVRRSRWKTEDNPAHHYDHGHGDSFSLERGTVASQKGTKVGPQWARGAFQTKQGG